MNALVILNFIIPFVMLLVGALLKRHPVAHKDSHQGYNTPAARKSQAHWDYAQSIAPDIFLRAGWALLWGMLVLSAALLLKKTIIWLSIGMGALIGFAVLIAAFVKTERQVNAYFED